MKKMLRITKITKIVKTREILNDILAEVSDEALLDKYSLCWEQLAKVYSKLFYGGLLTCEDLCRRIELRSGGNASHIPLAEIHGSVKVYECHTCGFTSHLHFSACPRCREINLRRLTKRALADGFISQHFGQAAR